MKFIAYLFYRYYSKGATKDIAYFSTLCALVMLFAIHFFQLQLLVGFKFLPTKSMNVRAENYLNIVGCLIPVFLLLQFLIKKSELKGMKYEPLTIKRGYLFLLTYIIASIGLLLFLVFLKNGKL